VLRSGTRLLPGAAETLATLHQAGVKLVVCSNKPKAFTQELVASLEIADRLTAVLGPEDVKRIKPAPDMLLAGLAKLEVTPAETLYVGDMVVDIQAARAAGVTVWVVPTGSDARQTLEAARPDRILNDLCEILRAEP
jgi:phosphoglycolate phosphatase